jgi:hypothetical protein
LGVVQSAGGALLLDMPRVVQLAEALAARLATANPPTVAATRLPGAGPIFSEHPDLHRERLVAAPQQITLASRSGHRNHLIRN